MRKLNGKFSWRNLFAFTGKLSEKSDDGTADNVNVAGDGADDKKETDKNNDYKKHLEQKNGDYSVRYTKFFNIFARVAAVVIAFGIWVYATENDTVVSSTTVSGIPVQLIESSDTVLSVISGYNNTVDVVLEGKKGTIRSITADDIKATADVSAITTSGRHTVAVNITAPDGTNVVSQSLSSIFVYLDSTTSVSVPVRVRYSTYMLDDGYELGDAVPSASQITVSGPEDVLKTVEAAEVSLDLGHISGSVSVTGNIVLVGKDGEEITNPYLKLQTSSVQVSVPVYITKTLPLTVGFKYGYLDDSNSKVSITPSQITVKGEASVLNKLTELSVATIDEKHVQSDSMVYEIVPPDGVYLSSADQTATVSIEHIGTELKSIVIDNFTVENPNGLKYELQSKSITVAIRGPSFILTYITADSITATVRLNFDKAVSGTSTVPVEIAINNTLGGVVYEVGEYTMPVRIS